MSVLEVESLRVELRGGEDIVDEVGFAVDAGELLGLVGESGSGKTTVALAMLGHARRGARIGGGSVRIGGEDILTRDDEGRRKLRGGTVAYVPQDPASALNPALRIGTQLDEVLAAHTDDSAAQRREAIARTLEEVKLPSDEEFLKRFPHQLSGGQQQRIGLAMAFVARPRVIVLDEPTTGLDVTTQAHVLNTVRELCRAHGVAGIYVSHDLAVVAEVTDRIAVMYSGRLVEVASTTTMFKASAHPYVRMLVRAIPEMGGRFALEGVPGNAPPPTARPQGCYFAPRCPYAEAQCTTEFPPVTNLGEGHTVRCYRHEAVRGLAVDDRAPAPALIDIGADDTLVSATGVNASYGERQVLFDVDLAVRERECLALVGESGSGKTTFARVLAGLHRQMEGELKLGGEPLAPAARHRDPDTRRAIQYVFQNPYGSLNPRKTIGQAVALPLRVFFGVTGREAEARVRAALERVALDPAVTNRFPDQLSGGERQRVAIARALVAEPRLLVCDEITSALDVSVQAAIVKLLASLQTELGLGLLFVTHNLPLIRTIAHEVAVLDGGRIVERGTIEKVFDSPSSATTKALLEDTPSLETGLQGSVA